MKKSNKVILLWLFAYNFLMFLATLFTISSYMFINVQAAYTVVLSNYVSVGSSRVLIFNPSVLFYTTVIINVLVLAYVTFKEKK